MDKAAVIFESYNMVVEQSYNRMFADHTGEDILKLKEESILPYFESDLALWESTPIHELDGVTPLEYFNHVTVFEDIIELFILGAKLCDKDLPEPLLNKIKSFGEQAVDRILELGRDFQGEHLEVSLMAIRTLGVWKIDRAVDPLLSLLHECKEEDEIVMEATVEALENIGAKSIDRILQAIESAETIQEAHEYLLGALVNLGKASKKDRILKCLKSSFLRMENKAIGAIYLGEYGDGRAVPVLRGYVEKNRRNMDPILLADIKGAILKLGGDVSDL